MTSIERQGLRMPSLGGATGWLNSESLGPAELWGPCSRKAEARLVRRPGLILVLPRLLIAICVSSFRRPFDNGDLADLIRPTTRRD